MNKKDITDFFNRHAGTWDAAAELKEEAVAKIMDMSLIEEGSRILDIGCGTGVLFEHYYGRGAAHVTGVDISPEMVKLAKLKYPQTEVICADAEETTFENKYDRVMVFNALPHFVSPQKMVKAAAKALLHGGRITIAHDTGRETLNLHHQKRAAGVSCELMEAEMLAEMLDECFYVDTVVSDDKMYIVSGIKK